MSAETDVIVVIFLTAIVSLVGFFGGRLFDIDWRCNQMRRFLRKDYIVVNVVDKDAKYILSKIVNKEEDAIVVGNDMWAVTRGRIYSKKKISMGFEISARDVRFESGAPNVYVTREAITPADFYPTGSEDDIIKPSEVGATLKAWVANQLAKALASIKNTQLYLIVLIVLVALNLIISGYTAISLGTLDKKVDTIQGAITPITNTGGKIQNGAVVIEQKPAGTGG